MLGVVGTLGTADTGGTAQVLSPGIDPTTGAMFVNMLAGSLTAANPSSGTLTQIGTVLGIGGTVQVSGASAGTNIQLVNGTLTLGTVVGKDANASAQTGNPLGVGGTDSGGTIRTILVDSTGVQRASGSMVMTSGTLTTGTLQNLATGTINALASGTISGGTLQNLVSGTVNALASGTITTGTVSVTTGTIVGKETSAAASVGKGILIAGTDSGGTIYYPLIDSTGAVKVSGASAGTNVNIVTGTINVGTVTATLTSNGTLTALGLGTITGKDANATAQSSNPIAIGGTDSGGTIRTAFVDSSGAMKISGASAGTFVNIATGTQQTLGTVGVLNTGTLNALASGTITNGTLQNLVTGTINALASGTITGGTLQNVVSGTLNALANGTITGGSITALTAQTSGISGTWTSSTGTTDLQLTLSGYPTITALINQTAGVSGGAITFEASDPAGNWYPVEMMATNGAQTVVTYALQSSTNVAFQMNVAGFTKFRARLSTAITGTATVIPTLVANASAAEWAQFITGGQIGTLTTGTIQNVSTGTINALAAGTITAGTLNNLVSGTINALASGTISGGTIQNLNAGTITALANGTITTGTISMTTGTLNGGTLSNLSGGTIQVDKKPINIGTSYGTVGTAGAAAWGTLIAASGAGTKQYVSGVDIVVVSGTVEVVVTNIGVGGSTGAGVLARGNFPPGGGISKNFDPVMASGTNGTLSYWLGGAGTADITIQYWQGV